MIVMCHYNYSAFLNFCSNYIVASIFSDLLCLLFLVEVIVMVVCVEDLIFLYTFLPLAFMEWSSASAWRMARWKRRSLIYATRTLVVVVITMLIILWMSTGLLFPAPLKYSVFGIGQPRSQTFNEVRNSRPILPLDVPFTKKGDGEEFESKIPLTDEGERKCAIDTTATKPPLVLGPPDERYGEVNFCSLPVFNNLRCERAFGHQYSTQHE